VSDAVLVALIGSFGLIGAALVGVLVELVRRVNKVHAKAEVVRDQVQNSHGTNLRDDLDALRATVIDGFASVEKRQDWAARTAVANRNEARTAAEAAAAVGRRLDEHIDSATD
jgi:hypothetical protein